MTSREYVYKISEVVRVVDGDSYWFRLSIGFRETILVNIRLYGYDCPERTKGSEFERMQAKIAAGFATTFLTGHRELWIRTEKDPDSFGRWLGDVWAEDPDGIEAHLGAELAAANLATHWPTRWRETFDR